MSVTGITTLSYSCSGFILERRLRYQTKIPRNINARTVKKGKCSIATNTKQGKERGKKETTLKNGIRYKIIMQMFVCAGVYLKDY